MKEEPLTYVQQQHFGMALLKRAFGQAHEKDNELDNTIAEERRDKGAPAPS